MEEGNEYNIESGTNTGYYLRRGRQALFGERYPIIGVSWQNAIAYCRWLSEVTGQSYRLPSEAEWEFAARGGTQSGGYRYAGSNKLEEVGWYNHNSHSQTKPVGLKLPNELGIYDMSGNVWEWCADYWHDNYDSAPADGSAWLGEEENTRRVIRGGSWFNNVNNCQRRGSLLGQCRFQATTISVFEWPGTNPLSLLPFFPL